MGLQNAYSDKLKKKTTNITTGLDSKLNTSGTVLETPTEIKDSISNDTTSTTTPTYNWQDYASRINAMTANSKAELQSSLQKANQGASNYLKALGLQGSGVGMSALTDIGTNYQNALANVNANAESELNNSLDSQFNSMLNSSKDNTDKLNAFIDKYGADTGKADEWASRMEEYGKDEETVVNNGITNTSTNIDSVISNEGLDGDVANALNNVKTSLSNATTNEEYNKILQDNYELLNSDSYRKLYNTFIKFTDREDKTDTLDSVYKQRLTDAVNSGSVTDGTLVRVGNKETYMYVNGKIYLLPSQYNSVNSNNEIQLQATSIGRKHTRA